MEDKSLNGNRTACQGSGLHGGMTLTKWPNSVLPVCLGITIRLVKLPTENTRDHNVLLNQCTQVQHEAGGGQKMGLLRDGNAKQTAALVTINTIPRAKCTAGSCGQILLRVQTRPSPYAI